MGKVRPNYIKDTCREILNKYSDSVTTNFNCNKELLKNITDISSKPILNKVAGYLVVLKKNEDRIIIPPKKEKKITSHKKKKHKCKNKARGRRKRKI